MAIAFNNIPTTIRTPGAYGEVDNSRALTGLAQNPQKVLIVGRGMTTGTVPPEVLVAISRDNLANGFFGAGSELARMCNKFKEGNPNTELWAVRLSAGNGDKAQANLKCSVALGIVSVTANGTLALMINGVGIDVPITSGWSAIDVASAIPDQVNLSKYSATVPVKATFVLASAGVRLSAVQSGVGGNYLDVRFNYYEGESYPAGFVNSIQISTFDGGTGSISLDDLWAVIENEHFHYIIQPAVDSANLTSLEDELEDRFDPLEDKQGIAFTAVKATLASATTIGNSRNSPHNCLLAIDSPPQDPAEWAAALGAVASKNLNIDPARPIQFLALQGILPPATANGFTRSERDILLYDGIATWIKDSGGNVMIERCITTYQSNALGLPDWSYLDVETLATLMEIRYQFKVRMVNRFLNPRFKLADDSFPVQPGSYVVTPKTIRAEIVSLFTLLRDRGLIENLGDFIENLKVERSISDVNRVDVLLPTDLINQFRVLAAQIQFIL